MKKHPNQLFKFKVTLLIIPILTVNCSKNVPINGRWEVVSTCILLTSFEEEKNSYFSACTGEVLTIADGKGLFENTSCLDTISFSFIQSDKHFFKQIYIKNNERFNGCIHSLKENELNNKIKIYSATLASKPKEPLYMFLVTEKDLILYQDPYFIQLKKVTLFKTDSSDLQSQPPMARI